MSEQTIPAEELKAIEGLIPNLYIADDTSYMKMRITQSCMAVGKATYLRSLEREKSRIMLSNISAGKQQDISVNWLSIWSEVENWYGDPKKRESAAQFLQRLQTLYPMEREEQAAKGPRWVKAIDRVPDFTKKTPILRDISTGKVLTDFIDYNSHYRTFRFEGTFTEYQFIEAENIEWLDESGAGDDAAEREKALAFLEWAVDKFLPSENWETGIWSWHPRHMEMSGVNSYSSAQLYDLFLQSQTKDNG